MTSMTTTTSHVTGGVDTHGQTHHGAALDSVGRQLGDQEFPTTPAGYRALVNWLQVFGHLERVGVEGTGTYGAGLTRQLRTTGVTVVEVDRPDRKARRAQGKSDPLDAYSPARAALARKATGVPKAQDGRVEAIRLLRVARSSAVKARSQATNQLKALLVTAPAGLRAAADTEQHQADRDLRPAATSRRHRRSRTCHQDRAAPPGPPPPVPIRRDQCRRYRASHIGDRRGSGTDRAARGRPRSRRTDTDHCR